MAGVFVDTSALYAVLDANDAAHRRAAEQCNRLLAGAAALATSSYGVVEVFALVQARLGLAATRLLDADVKPCPRWGSCGWTRRCIGRG